MIDDTRPRPISPTPAEAVRASSERLPTSPATDPASPSGSPRPTDRKPSAWSDYFVAIGAVILCCFIGLICKSLGLSATNIAMVFLSAMVIVSARLGLGPSLVTAVLGVLAFDFFFIPPVFAFASSDMEYIVTMSSMVGFGVLVRMLVTRVQSQLRRSQEQEQHTAMLYQLSRAQERRTAQLYQLTRQLSELAGTDRLLAAAGELLAQIFEGPAVLFLGNADTGLVLEFAASPRSRDSIVHDAAHWVARENRAAGLGTDCPFACGGRMVPMRGAQHMFGVLGVFPHAAERFADEAECHMLETCANLIALSIERDQSRLDAEQAQLHVNSEKIRNALLSSVSHDLRTPLAMIAVTASGLLDDSLAHDSSARREMLEVVVEESNRLSRQVDNLLEMARLNAGAVMLNCQWHVLEELIGVVRSRLRSELARHQVTVDIPADFPLLWVADELLGQVFLNLLENAARYTPPGSQIQISARMVGDTAEIRFADNGPGLPPGSETKVFEPFFRGRSLIADGQRGLGIGLAICQGLVRAHRGELTAANRTGSGAEFVISLPCPQPAPQISLDDAATHAV